MSITVQEVLDRFIIDDYFKNTNTNIELYSNPNFNSDPNKNDADLIKESITYLFNNSITAKQYFEQLVDDTSIPNIEINYLLNKSQVRTNVRDRTIKVEMDFAFISNQMYLTPEGKAAKYFPELGLMHEMIHAITALTDNPLKDTPIDYDKNSDGPTQREANKIHSELGLPERVSYKNVLDSRTYPSGTDFTNEKKVDDNFANEKKIDVGVTSRENLDTSNNNPPTRDLIIAVGVFGRLFRSGNGNDYLYGGIANDTLDAGGDDDYLDGDKGNDVLKGGSGNDILLGNEGNDDLDGSAGEDVAVFTEEYKTQNYDYEENEDGSITISHLNDGIDGVDTLRNIEWGRFNGGQPVPLPLPINAANTEPGIISQVAAATGSAPRIIPLPLEDIDYTLNISYMMKILEKTINLTR